MVEGMTGQGAAATDQETGTGVKVDAWIGGYGEHDAQGSSGKMAALLGRRRRKMRARSVEMQGCLGRRERVPTS